MFGITLQHVRMSRNVGTNVAVLCCLSLKISNLKFKAVLGYVMQDIV